MWQTIKTNVMGTLNMLGLAKRVGARYASFYSCWHTVYCSHCLDWNVLCCALLCKYEEVRWQPCIVLVRNKTVQQLWFNLHSYILRFCGVWQDPFNIHIWSIRWSLGASANRGILGECESHRYDKNQPCMSVYTCILILIGLMSSPK